MEEFIQEWPEKLLKRDKLVRRNRDVRRQIVDDGNNVTAGTPRTCVGGRAARFRFMSTFACHEHPAVWEDSRINKIFWMP